MSKIYFGVEGGGREENTFKISVLTAWILNRIVFLFGPVQSLYFSRLTEPDPRFGGGIQAKVTIYFTTPSWFLLVNLEIDARKSDESKTNEKDHRPTNRRPFFMSITFLGIVHIYCRNIIFPVTYWQYKFLTSNLIVFLYIIYGQLGGLGVAWYVHSHIQFR